MLFAMQLSPHPTLLGVHVPQLLIWKCPVAQECDGPANTAAVDGASSEASHPPYTMEDKGYVWALYPDGRKKQLIGSFAESD